MCYRININVMRKDSLIRQDNLLFLKDAIFIALRVVCSKRSEEITWIDPVHQGFFLTKPIFRLIFTLQVSQVQSVVVPWRITE